MTSYAALGLAASHRLEEMHTDLAVPSTIRFSPDGRLFYTEYYTGRIMVFPSGETPVASEWATVPVAVGGDRGLQGLAFHPQFPDSPYVYLFHTNMGPEFNRIVRMTDQGGVGIDYTVIVDSIPSGAFVHYGGRLAFGPDGLLYATFGDQIHAIYARDPTRLEGKILCYDPMGRPAPDVSFDPGNAVFAMGVRNPFGLCFDPVEGYGYFTDVGPNCGDELNVLLPGADYGWGSTDPCGPPLAATTRPLLDFTPPITPTGCCVYRGGTSPELEGSLFFGSWNEGRVYRAVIRWEGAPVVDTLEVFAQFGGFPDLVLDVTQGTDGRLWISTFSNIWRVMEQLAATDAPRPAEQTSFSVAPNPFGSRLEIQLGVGGASEIDILDAAGRRIRAWSAPQGGRVVWDGRSDAGEKTPAGVYWVRVSNLEGKVARRVVRLAR